jgi:isocitrate lyase
MLIDVRFRGRRAAPAYPATLLDFPARSRRLISQHWHNRKQWNREVSDQSRRGLDWTNFFMADVQMGFGSFLAFYLASLAWSKEDVGLAGIPASMRGAGPKALGLAP